MSPAAGVSDVVTFRGAGGEVLDRVLARVERSPHEDVLQVVAPITVDRDRVAEVTVATANAHLTVPWAEVRTSTKDFPAAVPRR